MTHPGLGRMLLVAGLSLTVVVGVLTIGVIPRLQVAGQMDPYQEMSVIQRAANSWRASNPKACPTLERLLAERYLDSTYQTSHNCRPGYKLECASKGVVVFCQRE